MDQKLANSSIRLLKDSKPITKDTNIEIPREEQIEDGGRIRRKAIFDSDIQVDDDDEEEESDDEEEEEESGEEDEEYDFERGLKWKVNLDQKVKQSFIERQSSTRNLQALVYGTQQQQQNTESKEDDDDELEAG